LLLVGGLFILNFKFLAKFGVPVSLLATPVIVPSMVRDILAVLFAITGLVIATAARRTLAGNWSGAVVIKDGHGLITKDLYRYVRNPIYSGILLTVLGTALSYGTLGVVVGFLVIVLSIWLKLHDEETILTKRLSGQYLAYKESTKALIPFYLVTRGRCIPQSGNCSKSRFTTFNDLYEAAGQGPAENQ
jgi:protein-S-isoprenylcysteine O-methyltransferase Ste14